MTFIQVSHNCCAQGLSIALNVCKLFGIEFMLDNKSSLRMKPLSSKVLAGGFFLPIVIISIFLIVFDEVVSPYFGGDLFYFIFSGVIAPIDNYSGYPVTQINALIVSVYGIPLWIAYWFLLGPKKIESGMITVRTLLKVFFLSLMLTLIYLIFCFIDNPAPANPKSILLDKLISNPIFFYCFVLCPIYFLSLCFSAFFRLTVIYLRK